jgi:fatty-acyl-CoA synthase
LTARARSAAGAHRIGYRDLDARLRTTAAFLTSRGVGKGDVVAVLLPINFRLAGPEIDYIVTNAGARGIHVEPDDLFRLMYTSGTTDHPEGVTHTYDNHYWKCLDHILALGLSASDRMLVVGPLYHVGAFATSTPTASRSRARATR